METYIYTAVSNSASSSSSSHSDSYNSSTQRIGNPPPPPAYRSSIRSVHKKVITKKPIAPMPPTPPKIYMVDPVGFRDLVQRLTAAPEYQRTRLQEVAPPPLSLFRPPLVSPGPAVGFNLLSPSSLAWCSSVLLSPGTLSSFETSAVL